MRDSASRRRFRGSLAASSVLHLALLAVLVPVVATDSVDFGRLGGMANVPAATTLSIVTIERHLPARHRPIAIRAAHAATTPMIPPAQKTGHRTHAVASASASRAVDAATQNVAAAHIRHRRMAVAVLLATQSPQRASLASQVRHTPAAATPAPAPSASAVPLASASPAASDREVAQAGIEVPSGGWGQTFEQPLVADDAALSALRAKFHVTAAISIAVDPAGHAVSITFPDGLSDEMRTDLERSLRQLRYVPAECNGLRCDGTLQITL